MSIGLSIIVAIITGSLLACIGFEVEWAASQLTHKTAIAKAATLFAGWSIILGYATLAIKNRKKVEGSNKKHAIAFTALYAMLLALTPRSFTYDTGLYHLPVILHLNELGLETNIGWLHSRYGFFNLLLYGQAMLARVTGHSDLPSLNSVVLAGTLSYTLEHIRKRRLISTLACGIVVAGALLIPSESTEGFHSYNADFSLGCIFLVCMIGLTNWKEETVQNKFLISILVLSFPLVKLSGLLLWPILVVPLALTEGLGEGRIISRFSSFLICYTLASVIAVGTFGYISTGYLAYPLALSGPVRPNSINKETAKDDSTLGTLGWARYAYSDQLSSIKANAGVVDWFPKWSKSINGKRMLSYLAASAIVFLFACLQRRSRSYILLIGLVLVFWLFAILVFPPDPRFYWGPILATLWLGTEVITFPINSTRYKYVIDPHIIPLVLITSWVCILFFTHCWRKSEYMFGKFPEGLASEIAADSRKPYIVQKGRKLMKSDQGACWDTKPPCTP